MKFDDGLRITGSTWVEHRPNLEEANDVDTFRSTTFRTTPQNKMKTAILVVWSGSMLLSVHVIFFELKLELILLSQEVLGKL